MGMSYLIPVLSVFIWLALAIYLLTLANRFVNAVERIADKFDSK